MCLLRKYIHNFIKENFKSSNSYETSKRAAPEDDPLEGALSPKFHFPPKLESLSSHSAEPAIPNSDLSFNPISEGFLIGGPESFRDMASNLQGRIKNAASTFAYDNQALIAEMRRAIGLMKEIAVNLEKENQSDMVKQLEDAVIGLLTNCEDCAHYSSAVQSVGDSYQPGEELTDFKKLFETEVSKIKANSASDPKKNPLIRQFKEAVWNVHHAGQLMPGEEQEDIVMTSTQCNILNVKCPITGKPVTELVDPVRSVECKHIYEKQAIMHYLRSKQARARCPMAGCPRMLQADKVKCDPMLLVDIDEVRKMNKETATTQRIEDITMPDVEEGYGSN
ncbi:hypothetical protein L6164_018412 [Bauhinia variegata]|uniref:Uncharacterized protein n=1 Tax=Bauhinia variegata TaxID=167791 RepID=A0ACB9NEK5_BAUVA|nr:hypothetical protein L6164_018412 [Bauhinia variegata]